MRVMWSLFVLACTGDPEPAWEGEGDACLSCHQGVEPVHGPPVDALDCTSCHGGDDTALTKEAAHVPVPDDWATIRGDALPFAPDGYIKDFAPDQLDQLPAAYVRFINPGDVRGMEQSCGAEGCHPSQVETVRRSIMTTNAGHYMPTLNLAGLQDNLAIYGSTALTDPTCDADDAATGAVCELSPLPPPPREDFDQALANGDADALEAIAYEHYLAKSCDTCHAAGYGDNNAPHKYRSTGCTSCHMVYDETGFYLGDDPTIPSATPSFSARHEITSNIPTEQCATCHFQGGRIGLLYRGIREAGFSGQLPPNAEAWSPGAYGKADPYFYLSDEDTTNPTDESPADLHFIAGMQCADCHVGSDVHGDGKIYSTSKQQVDLTCEDCHGTVRAAVTAGSDGVVRTAQGRPLPQLRSENGTIVLRGIDGTDREVTQVAPLVAEAEPGSPLERAMGIDGEGFSHTDSLTCDTCHTSYNQHCIGCHVSMDVRFSQRDAQTGLSSYGLVRGSRQTVSLDDVLLGTAPDGRVQSVIASQQVQMAIVDEEGTTVLGEDRPEGERTRGVFRTTPESIANHGFHVFFQHTTTRAPTASRPCETCHPATNSEAEITRVRGVYGFGTGEFVLPGPNGQTSDALQFLDADGQPLTTWVHEGTGPVNPTRRERALSVFLDELE